MNNIENQICEAIELIVERAVNNAKYDKTIQAVVQSCVDATIGKYKISYQDSSFYAYATNADITYPNGSMVYILVPGNDMSKNKTILGTVDKLGINYITKVDGDEAYDVVGTNCISSSGIYKLSSYFKPNSPDQKPTSFIKILYSNELKNNELQVDNIALKEYIKESSSLICGAFFRTSLAAEQQYQGNYGIVFGLDFYDNANGNEEGQVVTRYYTVDVDNMTGNPYKLNLGKRQYGIFDIDGVNFDKISSISLFVKDFPNQKNEDEITQQNLFDIVVSKVELSGAVLVNEEELNGCGISFYTPDGTFFSRAALDSAILRIIAKVKIKGKIVDSKIQKIPFYWFKEDLSIVEKSERYNKYGGRGWRCLNNYNVIVEGSEGAPRQVEWISAEDTYNLKITDVKVQDAKFKCVILYDGTAYSKTITIKNLKNTSKLTIESNLGTQFYYDIGRPTLTCYVDKKDNMSYVKPNDCTYIWAVEDAYGNLTSLPIDTVQNEKIYEDYTNAMIELTQLQQDIVSGKRLPNEAEEELSQKREKVDSFKYIQCVHDNEIQRVAVNEITNFATYKCSVFKQSEYLGTASIKLINTLETEDIYTLVINNGTQTYQYNEYGVSPASPASDNPIQIPILSFTVFDNLGKPLDKDILKHCSIKWKIPIKNTMLINIKADGTPGIPDANQEYQYYDGSTEIIYDIQNKYYYNFKNNDIELTVGYKGMNLTTKTNLSFVKTGEAGTNGTEYICKIVPNSKATNLPMYPTFTLVNGITNGGTLNFKYTETNGISQTNFIGNSFSNGAPFIVKLYKSGEEIFSGATSGITNPDITGEAIPVSIKWEMLANKYNRSFSDTSDLTIEENSGKIKYEGKNSSCPAHIIKCTVYYGTESSRYSIYATLPLITAVVKDSSYRINLKNNTGFRYVVYTSDGTSPKYDTTKPFEIEVVKNINGIEEIISMSNNLEYGINEFTWGVQGEILNYVNNKLEKSNDLIHQNSSVYLNKIKANQRNFKPNGTYNGLCVTNAVICECEVGKIHIPIHFLLNKHGLSQLNSWDGNSIQIDKEGGFILSPQMGAGIKESDNSFTGVLMGKVQEPNRKNSDIGLLGYNAGIRSFYLNAKDGSAILGSGQGQILMDPSSQKGLLYSKNYWKQYNEDGKPINYNDNNLNNQGLLIDLTTPKINFGNGNFAVDSEGHLKATQANISGSIVATDGKIGKWILDRGGWMGAEINSKWTFIAPPGVDGMQGCVFAAGGSYNNPGGHPFRVTQDGKLYASNAEISGSITATDGKIGKWILSENGWIGAESSGKWTFITPPGISGMGGYVIAAGGPYNDMYRHPFRVTQDGKLYASNAEISGSITATDGKIGSWNIGSDGTLSAGNVRLNSNGSITNTTGKWSINSDGSAEFTNVTITSGSFVAGNTIGSGIRGGNINNSSIGTSKFDSGVKTWVGDIAANKISAAEISANKITGGTMSADRISGGNITGVGININNNFRVSAGTGDVWFRKGVKTYGDGGVYNGWHTGITSSISLRHDLNTNYILYFNNGIYVGWEIET